jgi:CheY-like chemotaxis protein
MRVLWVDDDTEKRKKEAKLLEQLFLEVFGKEGLSIEVIHPEKADSRLRYKQKKPDLFLVDYNLNQIPLEGGDSYPYKGLTIAGMIRDLYPEYPIFVVSQDENAEIFREKSQAAKSSFEGQLLHKKLQRVGHHLLYFYARDYRKIREVKDENINEIFRLLKAPLEIQNRIKLVLPDELKHGFDKGRAGNSIAFAKWLQEIFITEPGFLYSDIYAATHLGLTVEAFNRISQENKKFMKARYSGIFSEVNEPLWWVTGLNKLVFSTPKFSRLGIDNTWEIGPKLFNVNENEYAKCAVCGEKYPDIVGINISDSNERKPIHFRCSSSYTDKKRELYFDEYRGFS